MISIANFLMIHDIVRSFDFAELHVEGVIEVAAEFNSLHADFVAWLRLADQERADRLWLLIQKKRPPIHADTAAQERWL